MGRKKKLKVTDEIQDSNSEPEIFMHGIAKQKVNPDGTVTVEIIGGGIYNVSEDLSNFLKKWGRSEKYFDNLDVSRLVSRLYDKTITEDQYNSIVKEYRELIKSEAEKTYKVKKDIDRAIKNRMFDLDESLKLYNDMSKHSLESRKTALEEYRASVPDTVFNWHPDMTDEEADTLRTAAAQKREEAEAKKRAKFKKIALKRKQDAAKRFEERSQKQLDEEDKD